MKRKELHAFFLSLILLYKDKVPLESQLVRKELLTSVTTPILYQLLIYSIDDRTGAIARRYSPSRYAYANKNAYASTTDTTRAAADRLTLRKQTFFQEDSIYIG